MPGGIKELRSPPQLLFHHSNSSIAIAIAISITIAIGHHHDKTRVNTARSYYISHLRVVTSRPSVSSVRRRLASIPITNAVQWASHTNTTTVIMPDWPMAPLSPRNISLVTLPSLAIWTRIQRRLRRMAPARVAGMHLLHDPNDRRLSHGQGRRRPGSGGHGLHPRQWSSPLQ